jgi:hypothetical protein
MSGARLIVDRVQGWRGCKGAPLSHRQVLDEGAALAVSYNGSLVLLDQHAAEPIAQRLTALPVPYAPGGPIRRPQLVASGLAASVAHWRRPGPREFASASTSGPEGSNIAYSTR